MFVAPMVHFEDGIIEREVLHSAFQLLVIGATEGIKVLVVDTHRQHEMFELALGNVGAPRQLLFGEKSVMHALAEIVFSVVHAVTEGHVFVKKFQGVLFVEGLVFGFSSAS